MPICIRPYSMRSKSAKDLAETLGCLRTQMPPTGYDIINWGSGSITGLNNSLAVSNAVNKIRTFDCLARASVRTPDWTTNKDVAKSWITTTNDTVFCRTTTNGHSGQGIVIAKTVLDLVNAPLYTKFIDKDAEFRIHVFDGRVIDQRQKIKASDGRPITSNYINTHNNGYVFQHTSAPVDCHTQAIAAVKALGLDFGAVDVVYKKDTPSSGKAYVLEVNTAPGLTGSTITAYANAIRSRYSLPAA